MSRPSVTHTALSTSFLLPLPTPNKPPIPHPTPNAVSDLAAAILASPDLLALMTPEQVATVRGLDPAALDASPELVQYVGGSILPFPFAAFCLRDETGRQG